MAAVLAIQVQVQVPVPVPGPARVQDQVHVHGIMVYHLLVLTVMPVWGCLDSGARRQRQPRRVSAMRLLPQVLVRVQPRCQSQRDAARERPATRSPPGPWKKDRGCPA